VRRGSVSIFELFNAAWCVWSPQPRGTQPRLRCSVVGLLRAPPAPRLRSCRGSAPCAFPVPCPLPDSVWPFGCHKAQSRILAAVWRPCESLWGWGRGIAGAFPGFVYKSTSGYLIPGSCESRHYVTYIGPPNGPIQRTNPVRYVQYECYEATAGSETRKLARGPCARTRALPLPLPRLKKMVLKVVKMGT
jgi:hypothetical protein